MSEFVNFLLIILLLLNLYLLASSNIKTCIKIVAFEGFFIGLIALFLHWETADNMTISIGLITIIIKTLILPYLLYRCITGINIKREIEPYISYTTSVFAGIVLLLIGFLLTMKINFPGISEIYLSCPVAIMTFFTGLIIIITRKKAISQVLGYLVFENGVYLFGELLPIKNSFVIEMGILLDVFVFIFVIGITVFHIRSEFNHIDTDKLSHLSDMPCRGKR